MASVQNPSPETDPSTTKRPPELVGSGGRRALGLLLLCGALLYGLGLGQTDLWAPDEPRYGAIAEELRSFRHGASGLVLLHLNGAPYTQKPPLYFWLAAAFGTPQAHVHEIAARLPSAIAGIVCLALTAWIGRVLFARSLPAVLAAGILATSFRMVFTARRAQLDVVLTSFELAAIAIFLALEFRRGGIEKARQFPVAIAGIHASLGAAALVKGPVGWLPLLVFAAYLAWSGRIRAFRAITPIWAWAISLGPITAWILAAIALAPPGFADAAVGENLIGRFFSGTSHARPFYYYALQLPMDFLPWSLLLPFSLPIVWRWSQNAPDESQEATKNRPDLVSVARFLLVWLIVPLLFFSLSAGKRGVYLLPTFPALALVCVLVATQTRTTTRLSRVATRRLIRTLLVVAAIELLGFTVALPLLDDEKSPRPIAEAIVSSTAEKEPVGIYGLTPLEGGLAYYGADSLVSLRDEADLQNFLAGGGKFVVLRARHFDALRARLHLAEVQSFRGKRRRLTLARHTKSRPQRGHQSATE